MSDANEASGLSRVLAKMTERERKLVALTAAVAVVLVLGGIALAVSSALGKREARIRQHRDELAQLDALRGQYQDAVAREEQATNKIKMSASTSLFSLLQKSSAELGLALTDLNERRAPVKDTAMQEVTVDVNLKEITIDKLTSFLEKIEGRRSDGVVKVTKIKMKTRFDNPELLEGTLTVSTWRAGEGKTP